MTRLAVAGSTGAIGRVVVTLASEAGHIVVPLSRSSGVDLVSGTGLDTKLRDVTAIIDCSDPSNGGAHPERILSATHTLLAAAKAHGCKRYIVLSIHGVQDPALQAFPLYKARFDQEGLIAASGLSHVVIRSTQWYEFALNPAGASPVEGTPDINVQDWLIQPVARDSVARYMLECAVTTTAAAADTDSADTETDIVTVAGPEQMRLPDLTRKYLQAEGDSRRVVPVPAFLDAMAKGALCPPPGDGEGEGDNSQKKPPPPPTKILGPPLTDWLLELAGHRE